MVNMKNWKIAKILLLTSVFAVTQCAKTDDESADNAAKSGNITVDASGSDFTYVNLRTAQTVTVTDPANDANWDIAFKGAKIKTNSGTSRSAGQGGAHDPSKVEISEIPADIAETEFKVDAEIETPPNYDADSKTSLNPVLYGCDSAKQSSCTTNYEGWYNYDGATHTVSPKNKAFVVRNADGSRVKIKIKGYASSTYNIDYERMQ